LERLDDLPLITFSMVPDHSLSLAAKRMTDFGIAVGMLALWSPLMLLVAALIKFTSPGPVFYRQTRRGRFGRPFTLVKFRTMHQGAEDRLWEIRHLNEMDGPVFKMRNDPRVTPLGRFLRLSSIDELPQLWNVIKGEMSVVGPRAPLGEEVRHYTFKQRRRLSVKPGITCLWQISGRNDIDFQKWMELDLEYIDNWTFWLDIRIILRTIPAVLTARGAR
ncbi:MAG: exopolysaccharide biosynthesis polyprenyl glycosylphosphotransferase, partial [Acidobacteriota bacterium]